MSYDLIYKVFTIKKGDKYIPFIVSGSNNCYELSFNGRQRRDRNLSLAYWLFNGKKEFNSLNEMDTHFKFNEIQNDMNNGNLQGNFKSANRLLNSFKKYIFNSDELRIKPRFISLYYIKITDKEKENITNIFEKELNNYNEILTEKETKEITEKCLNQIDEKIKKELYKDLICYSYSDYEYLIKYAFKNKYTVTKKERFTNYEDMIKLIDTQNAIEFNKDMTDTEFESKITPFFNKQIVLKSNDNYYRGKIRKTYKGDIGFFKYRIRNRYNILSKNDYGYANLKVDKIVEIK